MNSACDDQSDSSECCTLTIRDHHCAPARGSNAPCNLCTQDTHGASGLTQMCKASDVSMVDAEQQVLDFVQQLLPESMWKVCIVFWMSALLCSEKFWVLRSAADSVCIAGPVLHWRLTHARGKRHHCTCNAHDFICQGVLQPNLAGNSVHNDYAFLRRHMPRLFDALSFRLIDVSTLNELCRRWMPAKLNDMPEKSRQHRAMDDIWESIAELRCYRKHMFGVSDKKAPVVYRRDGHDYRCETLSVP